MEKPKILIVEDDDFVRNQMKWALAAQYEVLLAEDRLSAMEIFRAQSPMAVTLDLGLPPSPGDATEGFRALSDMLQMDPLLKVVIISGQDEKENALAAIGRGAHDFFCKPVDVEALKVVIGRAIRVSQFERQNRGKASVDNWEFEGMLGKCSKMQAVFQDIRKVAVSEAAVLVTGESGTGKELAARAIHRLSSRKNGPFVAINCGAIPETLLESELFGHEKGAFTGAHIQRSGRLELAHGGTLFLDEIGEISPSIQVKLLRFLQDQVIERVGGRKSITVDARIICATNSDLHDAMAKGEFREDLYYRTSVLTITMPPLRERNGDIRLISQALLDKFAAEHNKSLTFNPKTLDALEAYSWPGNVRELENQLKRAVVMVESKQILPRDLALNDQYNEYRGMGLNEVRESIERDLIEQAIARNRGNLTRCAEELRISRSTLYELIAKLQIDRK
jgi:two-component system, NtrC family, response regulator